jgi:uncharacterized damage-inducible protein DinB
MNIISRAVLVVAVLLLVPAASSLAGGFTRDMLSQLESVEHQILQLEQAMPQEKYSWRPGDGVRSVSEVYAHIASGNYLMMKLAGFPPPEEANWTGESKTWETQTSDKAKLETMLKKSFEHVRKSLAAVGDSDLEVMVDFFGQKVTKRSALISALNHLHEHLGQSIAYARVNGIVPPWSLPRQNSK